MIRISGFSNTCPICQDLRFEKIFSKAGFDFVTCEECSLIYITPKPIDEEINTIYSKDYYNRNCYPKYTEPLLQSYG